MYIFFHCGIFVKMCIFKAQNGEKLQEYVFFHFLAPFGHHCTPFLGRIKNLPDIFRFSGFELKGKWWFPECYPAPCTALFLKMYWATLLTWIFFAIFLSSAVYDFEKYLQDVGNQTNCSVIITLAWVELLWKSQKGRFESVWQKHSCITYLVRKFSHR